jgi:hypothetical protein
MWPIVKPKVIYKHVEPWYNGIDRGKFLIRPPELSGNPTTRVKLVANQEELSGRK